MSGCRRGPIEGTRPAAWRNRASLTNPAIARATARTRDALPAGAPESSQNRSDIGGGATQNRSDTALGSALGHRLRTARRNARLGQGALAALAECSVRSVWQAERGRGRIDLYLRLVSALGCEVAGRSLPPGGHLGARLAALRRRLGVSLRETAAGSGVSANTLAAIERGKMGHLAAIERIAETLGAGLTLIRKGEAARFYNAAGVSSACEAWATPEEFLRRLHAAVGRIDLDPCSPGKLHSRVRAARHYTTRENGLLMEWHGRVFMNPPYGRTIGRWVAKARSEVEAGHAEWVIGLVPARTDTRWWHDHVAGLAHAWLLRGRLAFGDGTTPAPFPSAVVLWGGSLATAAGLSAVFPAAHYIPPHSPLSEGVAAE
jgi:phage N-6-adenine-methyltransferase